MYGRTDWNPSAFNALLKKPARIKQVYDIVAIGDGRFLNNIKNSLNGLHFGFGIPADAIQVVAALHGPSNLVNYDDYVWQKYRVGEWLKVEDPKTGAPAVRNVFSPSVAGSKLQYAQTTRTTMVQRTRIRVFKGCNHEASGFSAATRLRRSRPGS
ncbi:MAG: hypothetical protein ACR2JB_08100 [Bryobacteraceae bacterium]